MAKTSSRIGVAALIALALGPLAAHFGLVRPLAGFGIFALAIPLALIGLVLGVPALWRGTNRGDARRGLLASAFALVVVVVLAAPGGRFPRINDITTDTANPPRFVHAGTLLENAGRDMTYPGAEFARQQRQGYPDLAPLRLDMPPDEAFAAVQKGARQMDGWVITDERPEARAIEGYEATPVFRFKDDFVIEVRAVDAGSVVQMRSKSRDGRGDLGANASRIRRFFETLR